MLAEVREDAYAEAYVRQHERELTDGKGICESEEVVTTALVKML